MEIDWTQVNVKDELWVFNEEVACLVGHRNKHLATNVFYLVREASGDIVNFTIIIKIVLTSYDSIVLYNRILQVCVSLSIILVLVTLV